MGGLRPRVSPILATLLGAVVLSVLIISDDSSSAAVPIIVNSTDDPGDGLCDPSPDAPAGAEVCTLREAISKANLDGNFDEIHFDLPGGPPFKIALASELPSITEPVWIAGDSQQPEYDIAGGTPVIQIDGASTGAGVDGLRLLSNDSRVQGLAITSFSDSGIFVSGGGNVISNNYVGLDTDGNADGNNTGIRVMGDLTTVYENTISGNDGHGITVRGDGSFVLANRVGTDPTGSFAIPNGGSGITLTGARSATIGSTTPGEGNIISGNLDEGVHIEGGESNTVIGNHIGTDATGSMDIPNSEGVLISLGAESTRIGGIYTEARNVISGNIGSGVEFDQANDNVVLGNYIGTDGTGSTALGNGVGVLILSSNSNTVGGTSEGSGNLISGNDEYGLQIIFGEQNEISGNIIGPDATATSGLGGQGAGVEVQGDNNAIGGSSPGAGNILSGNAGDGVALYGTGNRVQGNWIGTTPSGEGVPNANGIVAIESANLVGGAGAGEGNTIAFNGSEGVDAIAPTEIRANSIHSNGQKGIRNDSGNPAPPSISSVGSAAGTACANCTIDVFSDDEGEGRVYHGSTVADATGNWSFAGPVSGPNVTATATDQDGHTSEFSSPVVVPTPEPTPAPVGGSVELPVASPDASTSIGLFAIIPSTLAAALAFAALRSTRRTRA